MKSWINKPEALMASAGICFIAVGSLYFPLFPWYILGDVREEEIRLWGLCAMLGGGSVLGGALLYRGSGTAIKKFLLLLCMVGMGVALLAQVPAYFSWLLYGGTFTGHWMPWAPIGLLMGILLHTLLCVTACVTIATAGRALGGRLDSGLRLDRKTGGGFIVILAAAGISWWGWDTYQGQHWITVTNPLDGAVEVERDLTITANWEGERRNNLGMQVRYADQPDVHIPGETGAGMHGMTFRPEKPLASGRKLIVTVEAGRRNHSFSFTTE